MIRFVLAVLLILNLLFLSLNMAYATGAWYSPAPVFNLIAVLIQAFAMVALSLAIWSD